MENMVIDDRLIFFWKSVHKPWCHSVPALKYQCSANVKQPQRCLQLNLLEPRRTSYKIPRYLISDNDN